MRLPIHEHCISLHLLKPSLILCNNFFFFLTFKYINPIGALSIWFSLEYYVWCPLFNFRFFKCIVCRNVLDYFWRWPCIVGRWWPHSLNEIFFRLCSGHPITELSNPPAKAWVLQGHFFLLKWGPRHNLLLNSSRLLTSHWKILPQKSSLSVLRNLWCVFTNLLFMQNRSSLTMERRSEVSNL